MEKPQIECTISGCSKIAFCKGMCRTHYGKQYRLANKDRIASSTALYNRANRQHILDRKKKHFISKRDIYIAAKKVNNRTLKTRYSNLRNVAGRRRLEFSLSMDEYAELVAGQSCHYCDGILPQAGSGLDRKDSDLGYSKDNCVPCCAVCNTAKSNNFTYSEMVDLGSAIKRIIASRDSNV